jgi:hypothetical protein
VPPAHWAGGSRAQDLVLTARANHLSTLPPYWVPKPRFARKQIAHDILQPYPIFQSPVGNASTWNMMLASLPDDSEVV